MSPRWLFRSLGVQLAVLTTVSLLAAIAAFGIFLAQAHVRAIEGDIMQRTAITTHQVAGGVTGPLLVRDYLAVENQLLILEPVLGFRDIYVIGADGNVLTHVTADGSGFLKAVFRREAVAPPPGHSPQQFRAGNLLESWYPIGETQVLGWVRLVSDLGALYAEQQQIYRRTALAGFVAALFSLTLLFAFLRPRIKALNALTAYAATLNADSNHSLVVYRGSSDIEALGTALSQAAQRIAADAEALRLEKSRLRTVVENMPVLMNALDADGHVIVWNKECEHVTGYSAAEIVGNPGAIAMLYPDEIEREAMIREWQRRGSAFRDSQLTLTAKSGARRTIAWSNLSDEYPIPGWAAWSVGIDITEIKENERLKDEFVSTVNHEMRTPLTAIHGALRLMANDVVAPLPPAAHRLVDVAERNCARLGRLISDVLDLQRIQSGQVPLACRPLGILQLIQDVVEANRPYAEQHRISLEFARDLSTDAVVLGDADKLTQVFTNLVSNAIKFSPAGSAVEIRSRSRGHDVAIEVRDHGPGISAAFASRIFQRFSRAEEGPTQHVGGTGLGLCISKELVEQHQGRIEFENNPDGGATFRVVLPAERSRAVASS